MRRWFLSYTSQDFALTQALKAALQRKDPDAGIFFAPEDMRAGGFWKPQLAKKIEESTAFILLVGEKGLGDWQVMEYYEALDRRAKELDYPIILILSAQRPAPGLPFARQLHWVLTEAPGSEATIGKLLDAVSGPAQRPGELWRFTRPYRGLEAMTEANSDYFFGRDRKTVEVIDVLAAAPGKLPILLGNSGVGKSSLAQAGVLAALLRQGWSDRIKDPPSWPEAFHDSRRWCFLTLRPGTHPLQSLVALFFDTWQYTAASAERVKEEKGWIELLRDGKAALPDLLTATERRYEELGQTSPPAFFLYIDQGEELYVRAEERERRRFSEILAHGLGHQCLRALMSMRSDFLGELQGDELLFDAHRQINVPPLREPELREVVSRPAELLSARFETESLVAMIARRTAEESAKDAGALPLLSYLLDDMWTQMVERGDGVLRLPEQAFELGSVLVRRANAFVSAHPDSEDKLRRIFTLRLATVREGEEPTRRRAWRSEFSDEEWRLVSELADHPNRLLVTATPDADTTLAPETAKPDSVSTAASRETYAEVAHEAIFRRWDKLREWIAAEREFLAWKTGLEAARRAWQVLPEYSKNDALLMGLPLEQARTWLDKRTDDIPQADRAFITQSRNAALRRRQRVAGLVSVLAFSLIAALIGWLNQTYLQKRINWFMTMRPYKVTNFDGHVLTSEDEQALKALASFHECVKDCPEMIVIPGGSFMMGSPATEAGRHSNEGPQHLVTITRPFAVSKFDVTFAEWDACVSVGGCPQVGDSGFGRGTRPAINVSWNDAKQYANWLSKMTGRPYRLPTEAEWEYAARAGSTSAYFWGDEIGRENANCTSCGSQWDGQTAPVGSFAPNAFGLYEMVGNVWQWIEDCYHNYDGVPTDGLAWTIGDCNLRVIRGGSWFENSQVVRSAYRDRLSTDIRGRNIGFRVGRTLSAGAGAITVAPGAH
jgi:formylglycine-generating enzyme required for sulfatase activity